MSNGDKPLLRNGYPVDRASDNAFVQKLLALMDDAMRANLPVTRRALHGAVKAVGWEMADDPVKAAEEARKAV